MYIDMCCSWLVNIFFVLFPSLVASPSFMPNRGTDKNVQRAHLTHFNSRSTHTPHPRNASHGPTPLIYSSLSQGFSHRNGSGAGIECFLSCLHQSLLINPNMLEKVALTSHEEKGPFCFLKEKGSHWIKAGFKWTLLRHRWVKRG